MIAHDTGGYVSGMFRRSRSRQRFIINRRWTLGVASSVAMVIGGILGIVLVRADVLSRPWAYASLVIAIAGAATALVQTIARAQAGDKIDEPGL